jgi:hypothetical protein
MHAMLISIYIAWRDDSFSMASAATADEIVLLEEE